MRGIFLLILTGAVTYYAKFRPREVKIVKQHGLAGWIFKNEGVLSALLILPNDGNYQNDENTGERYFFNPAAFPASLDSNFIFYNKRDLFLLGNVLPKHIQAYCSEIDSTSSLFFTGDKSWEALCPQSSHISLSSGRISSDRITGVYLNSDSVSGQQMLRIIHKDQTLIFAAACRDSTGPAALNVCLSGVPGNVPEGDAVITPVSAYVKGKEDSSLIPEGRLQALGMLADNQGRLLLKKIWLRIPVQ